MKINGVMFRAICVPGDKKGSFSYNSINYLLSNDAKLNMYFLT